MMRIIKVVAVSPGDVQTERDVLPIVMDELNKGIAGELNLRLEPWRWETDSYAGFHPEGPQGLIDELMQIEQSDIVIGMFWKRFGTQVHDARSGTEHELRRAIKAWTEHARPQIMVYFRQEPYNPRDSREFDQWKAVKEFREQFPVEGCRWDYDSTSHFEKLVRQQITTHLRHKFGNLRK